MYFPKDFFDIGEKSFEWVYENKAEFVEHTLKDMRNATGIFQEWQQYCKMRVSESVEN